jgi:hypothetical protein
VTPTETKSEVAGTTLPAVAEARSPSAGPGREGFWARARSYAAENLMLVAFIFLGVTARIVFWAATDRKIDDAMITIKFDKNLADGFGLIHNLGEGHVQGFTSALSVLVPMPGELIYHGGGFLFIRLASVACFALAAVYAYRIAGELELGRWPTGFILAFLALDQNQVFFGVAGMETQIAVAVLLAGVYYVLIEDYPRSGVALGLALLARPDFALWVAPAYAFLIIRNYRQALRAAALSAAIVGPWLIFTWIYYGSPVPNTITAKNNAFVPDFPSVTHPGAWINFVGDQLSAAASAHAWTIFAPFYEAAFLIHAPISYDLAKAIAFLVAALAVIGALSTMRRASFMPVIAYILLFAAYRVLYLRIGYFEWYGVPAVAALVLVAGVGLDRICRWVSTASRGRFSPAMVAAAPAVLLALVYAVALPFRTVVEARVQHDIEDKVRDPVGRYVGEVVKPGETITSESSGYVGYYTNATLYDFPGLESPRVVSTLQKSSDTSHPVHSLLGLAELLHSDWLVLRPWEAPAPAGTSPEAAPQYTEVRRFSVPSQAPISFHGFDVNNIDRDFIIYRRKP